jgi:O-antigen ligase
MHSSVYWDEAHVAKVLFYVGSAICGAGVALGLGFVATGRIMSDITTQLFLDTVNPITFSHTGVTTLLAAAALAYGKTRTVSRGTLILGTSLAVGCMVLAASRGPLVSLVACVVTAAFAQNRWTLLVLLAALGGAVAMSNADLELLERFERLRDLEADESSLERLLLQANALKMFEQSPIIGAAHAEFEMNTYPHNVFIETAMALGVVGLLPLIGMMLLCFWNSLRLLRQGQMLLPLLFIQYFVGFQFSGALWGSSAYWACTGLLLCASVPLKRRKAPTLASAVPLSNPAI